MNHKCSEVGSVTNQGVLLKYGVTITMEIGWGEAH